MQGEPDFPSSSAFDTEQAIVQARHELSEVQGALEQITGGASPRALLAELAHQLAGDLAAFFDGLPMELMVGRVARLDGPWGRMIPGRRVPHRLILARYLSATPPFRTGVGYTTSIAKIAVLAVGVDGVLRIGVSVESIHLPEDVELTFDPLVWDDVRIRHVPSHSIQLVRWDGDRDRNPVAPPGRVIEALTAVAALVARESQRDLALLKRFL